jgi:hypothetical protein
MGRQGSPCRSRPELWDVKDLHVVEDHRVMGRRGSPGRGRPQLWGVEALHVVADQSYGTPRISRPWKTVLGRRGSLGRGGQ